MNEELKLHIYNQKQVGYYMYNGVYPLEQYQHHVTKKWCYVFTKAKTNHLYTKWLELCDLNRA